MKPVKLDMEIWNLVYVLIDGQRSRSDQDIVRKNVSDKLYDHFYFSVNRVIFHEVKSHET